MTYQISEKIDKNKIFIINRSEINLRLDPYYNKPMFSEIWHKLSSITIPLTSLRDNSQCIFSGITPKSKGDAYVLEQGIPFVRSGDFSDNNEIDFSSLLLLREDVHNGIMRGSQLKKGDLLIAIVGTTIGKIGVYKYETEANINQAICGVRLKKTLNPYYVQAFYQTNIGQKIIDRIKRPVARANINLEEVGNLPIPLLDYAFQNEIVKLMHEARCLKLQKETEAQQLIDSINDYILNELGIIIPKVDTTLEEKRIFYSFYKDIIGKRLDPKKYSPQVRNLYTSIETSNFHKTTLSALITEYCSGDWGIEDDGIFHEDYIKCLTLRSTEIDNQYNIEINPDKVKYRLIKYDTYNKMSIAENDILIEKSGGSKDQPVGRVAIIDRDLLQKGHIAFSNFLLKIKVKDINPYYLYYYMKTMYNIGITESMQSQTNGIRNLITDEFLSQTIVVPSPQKQQEIVDKITNIKNKAKALQREGKNILEYAKLNVERMIIGE